MHARQGPRQQNNYTLYSERLGPLPLINHFFARAGLEALLDKYVPLGIGAASCAMRAR
jgi:hypothetical protein